MRRNKKKSRITLEVNVKILAFFLILLFIVLQQETNSLSNTLSQTYHPEVKLISNLKSFVTLFNNIMSYFKVVS
nr:hypothetical protein [Mucilaginibacter sp. SP1R1]